MQKIISTSSYRNKIVQSQQSQRFLGTMTVEVFIPKPDIQTDPNNKEEFREDYEKQQRDLELKAEQVLRQAASHLEKLPLDIRVGEVKVIDDEL